MSGAVIVFLGSLGTIVGGAIILRFISAWRDRATRRENASISMLRESQGRLTEELKRLEGRLHEGLRSTEARADEEKVNPVKRGKTLADRLQDLGLSYSSADDGWDYLAIPEAIRGDFAPPIPPLGEEDEADRLASCASCAEQAKLKVVFCDRPDLYPGLSFGIFCLDCGRGRLFPEVNNLRQLVGLPDLPDRQLMSLILALEAEAKKLEPAPALPSSV